MISIVIPSMGRVKQLDVILRQFESEIPDDAEIIAVIDSKDTVSRKIRKARSKTKFVKTKTRGCWRCTSLGLDKAKFDFVMWTADDIKPYPGWYEKASERFRVVYPDGLGLMALNDMHMLDQVAGHVMTTKQFVQVLFDEPRFPNEFYHFFCDTMIADWTRSIRRLHYCEDAILEHMHWKLGKSEMDKTNEICIVGEDGTDDKAIKDRLDEGCIKEEEGRGRWKD